jgi:hypothetical protein
MNRHGKFVSNFIQSKYAMQALVSKYNTSN